jgi:hypothetical protein
MKVCSKCGVEKNESDFSKHKNTKDGLQFQCKKCFNERKTIRKYGSLENYQEILNKKENISKENKRICTKCNLEKYKSEFGKDNRYSHKCRAWCKSCELEYKINRRKTDPYFKCRNNVSRDICRSLKNNNTSKNGENFINKLPYNIHYLVYYIENLFTCRMNWNNQGMYDKNKFTWQLDHIIPHSLFFYKSPNDINFKICWHPFNLRPIETIENLKKSNKINIEKSEILLTKIILDLKRLNQIDQSIEPKQIINSILQCSMNQNN